MISVDRIDNNKHYFKKDKPVTANLRFVAPQGMNNAASIVGIKKECACKILCDMQKTSNDVSHEEVESCMTRAQTAICTQDNKRVLWRGKGTTKSTSAFQIVLHPKMLI